jgi:hypothetical protein
LHVPRDLLGRGALMLQEVTIATVSAHPMNPDRVRGQRDQCRQPCLPPRGSGASEVLDKVTMSGACRRPTPLLLNPGAVEGWNSS